MPAAVSIARSHPPCFAVAAAAAAVAFLLLGRPAGAAPASAPAATEPLQLGEDGSTVIDARSRLVWQRCVEGMRWDGRQCGGEAQLFSLAQAGALVQQRTKADGLRWRLPRVPELRRLVDRAAKPPGPDARYFPQAPRDWHWSSSVTLKSESVNPYNYGNVMQGRGSDSAGGEAFLTGWAVNLASGQVRGDVAKSARLLVRLVRPLE